MAENLDFPKNGNFTRAKRNGECCEKWLFQKVKVSFGTLILRKY